ncbi:MAG: hypothetical protein GXY36_12905 [Chloroflexi bacterium]|mgnify:CR=1 FL=1|nr:hypothetical protein [Chloroflexota bacterium]
MTKKLFKYPTPEPPKKRFDLNRARKRLFKAFGIGGDKNKKQHTAAASTAHTQRRTGKSFGAARQAQTPSGPARFFRLRSSKK